jgi:hypothetical protein
LLDKEEDDCCWLILPLEIFVGHKEFIVEPTIPLLVLPKIGFVAVQNG